MAEINFKTSLIRRGIVLGLVFIALTLLVSRVLPKSNLLQIKANLTQNQNSSSKTLYSFFIDDDNDGLSNAKEEIYGTDPKNPDTDSDGYQDGQEVKKGYDPAAPGKARLDDRPNLSLTIQFLTWSQEKLGSSDPQIEPQLVQEFFSQKGKLTWSLPEISLSEIKLASENNDRALQTWLQKTAEITLPQIASSYQEIAQSLLAEKPQEDLAVIIQGLEKAYQSFSQIPTPSQALELQKDYLGSLKLLLKLFSDLKKIRQDPVQIRLNQQIGLWLAQKMDEMNVTRAKLAQSLKQQDEQI